MPAAALNTPHAATKGSSWTILFSISLEALESYSRTGGLGRFLLMNDQDRGNGMKNALASSHGIYGLLSMWSLGGCGPNLANACGYDRH